MDGVQFGAPIVIVRLIMIISLGMGLGMSFGYPTKGGRSEEIMTSVPASGY